MPKDKGSKDSKDKDNNFNWNKDNAATCRLSSQFENRKLNSYVILEFVFNKLSKA
ncbi:hypothetical protein TcasGA2_TC032672 [Tribolium castaneum]|uniref:Uncharacterized protein n=1 Tax=Tribolium castaneum TaxID=7070 RepID=A0A139WK18_TRICA|nr:hypothetical protein TcasGA2_TC032672 [Tribolium castaneum]